MQRDIHQLAREGTHQVASILRSEGCTSTRCIGFCIQLLSFLRFVPSALGAVGSIGPVGTMGAMGAVGAVGALKQKAAERSGFCTKAIGKAPI